jgi:hypothetical protein
MSAAQQRWNAFLAQIEQRHAQVRAESEQFGTAYNADDLAPLSHHLMGVKSRLQDLEQSIEATWHAKVDDVYAAEGASGDVRGEAFMQGRHLGHRLDDEREESEIRILAEQAQRRFESPRPELAQTAAAIGAHVLAQQAATGEWRAMRTALRALNAYRPPAPLAAVKAYERAQIAYWRAYLTVRARYEPAIQVHNMPFEIGSRMEQWYVSSAEFEPAWVQAGRPREPL